LPGVSRHPAKIAILTGKRWRNGQKLGVRFLDGSRKQRAAVMRYAVEWSRYANIRFDFAAGKGAEIRVSFEADADSWSGIGTECLVASDFPKNEPTVNFGWLRDDTDSIECRRVVLHEFGHVLGAIHEHQRPHGIRWRREAVYRYFSGPPNNWSKDDIDFNVIQKYSTRQRNGTKFDRKSIMLYEFPAELIVGGKATHENDKLSTGDKRFIRRFYPKRG
jgi:hypothetical protein